MPSRPHHTRALLLSALSALSAVNLLSGCTTPETDGSREVTVAAGSYPAAFDAAREALRELEFTLDRVDAAAGVISTDAHYSQGILEPWDKTQSGMDQEWEDAFNMQAREVRVTFAPAEGDTPADLRESESELVATIQAIVLRQHRAGRRLDSENVGASSFYSDPELNARHGARYTVPLRRDHRLESRIAATISEAITPDPDDSQARAAD